MSNPLLAIAEGTQVQLAAADEQQLNDTAGVILYVVIVAALQKSCQALLENDKECAMLANIGMDPHPDPTTHKPNPGQPLDPKQIPAYTEAYQEIYQTDSSKTDAEIRNGQSTMQNLKSQVQTDGGNMSQAFTLLDPMQQMNSYAAHQLSAWARKS